MIIKGKLSEILIKTTRSSSADLNLQIDSSTFFFSIPNIKKVGEIFQAYVT